LDLSPLYHFRYIPLRLEAAIDIGLSLENPADDNPPNRVHFLSELIIGLWTWGKGLVSV